MRFLYLGSLTIGLDSVGMEGVKEASLSCYFPFSSICRKVNNDCCAQVPGDLLKGDTKVNIASAAGTLPCCRNLDNGKAFNSHTRELAPEKGTGKEGTVKGKPASVSLRILNQSTPCRTESRNLSHYPATQQETTANERLLYLPRFQPVSSNDRCCT